GDGGVGGGRGRLGGGGSGAVLDAGSSRRTATAHFSRAVRPTVSAQLSLSVEPIKPIRHELQDGMPLVSGGGRHACTGRGCPVARCRAAAVVGPPALPGGRLFPRPVPSP